MKKVLRLFHTQGYNAKSISVSLHSHFYFVYIRKIVKKISVDDNTQVNVGHFAKSDMDNYCQLVLKNIDFEPVLERELSIVDARTCNYRCLVMFALSPLLQTR